MQVYATLDFDQGSARARVQSKTGKSGMGTLALNDDEQLTLLVGATAVHLKPDVNRAGGQICNWFYSEYVAADQLGAGAPPISLLLTGPGFSRSAPIAAVPNYQLPA